MKYEEPELRDYGDLRKVEDATAAAGDEVEPGMPPIQVFTELLAEPVA